MGQILPARGEMWLVGQTITRACGTLFTRFSACPSNAVLAEPLSRIGSNIMVLVPAHFPSPSPLPRVSQLHALHSDMCLPTADRPPACAATCTSAEEAAPVQSSPPPTPVHGHLRTGGRHLGAQWFSATCSPGHDPGTLSLSLCLYE